MAGRDIHEDTHHYHAPGSGPGGRFTPRRMVLAAGLAVILAAVGIVFGRWYGDHTTADAAAAKRRGDAAVDRHSPPFQVVVDGPDLSRQEIWAFVLDRTLTPQEVAEVERFDGRRDFEHIAALLRPLGARLLPEGGVPEIFTKADPGLDAIDKRYEAGGFDEGSPSHGDTYRLHFTSDRATPVTVESITTTDVSCRPTRAVTYVGERPQGIGLVPSIYLSLRDPAGTPAIEVDNDGVAVSSDYFAHNKIDVGQDTTPGDLNVEVGGRRHNLCSWKFKVDYLTPNGKFSTVIDDRGKPFSIEDRPSSPAQDIRYVNHNFGFAWEETA